MRTAWTCWAGIPGCVAAVLLSAGWPGTARADGFRNPPDGASALGRVGGKFAFGGDATAVSHNPANLADLEQSSALVSATFIHGEREFTGLDGTAATTEEPWTILPGVYGALPLGDGDLVLGLAVTVPYGQSTEWPAASQPGRAGPYYAQMMVVNANPSLAARLADWLALGVGIDLLGSDLEMKRFLDLDGNGQADAESRLEADGTALSWNLGATLQAGAHRLALTYRHGFDVEYDGDLRMGGVLPAGLDVETEIRFPRIVGLGYGWQSSATLRFAADLEWLEHSRFESLPLDVRAPAPLLQQMPMLAQLAQPTPQRWDDTWTFGLCAEWTFVPDWVLRGGGSHVETPVPDETLMPSLAEGDQTMLALGLGYAKAGHALDLALAAGIMRDREVRNNQNPAFNGDYAFESLLVAVSYGYTF